MGEASIEAKVLAVGDMSRSEDFAILEIKSLTPIYIYPWFTGLPH